MLFEWNTPISTVVLGKSLGYTYCGWAYPASAWFIFHRWHIYLMLKIRRTRTA